MLLLAPLALASSAVLTVDGSGGADFVEIASAVQAAAPGDTILVSTGSYGGFVVEGGSLSIVADDGAVVDVLGTVVLRGGAPADALSLAGLRVQGVGGLPALRVEDRPGAVVIDDCLFIGAPTPTRPGPWDGAAARFERAERVAISDTSFFGVDSGKAAYRAPGGVGLVALDSNLHLADVLTQAGDGTAATLTTPSADGGAGIDVSGGQLWLQGTRVRGGDGGQGSAVAGTCAGGDGGPGLAAYAARVFHRGTAVAAGHGGATAALGAPCSAGLDGRAFLLTGGSLQELPGPSRALDIAPNPAREGEVIQLDFRASGGDFAMLAFAPEPAFDHVGGLEGLRLVGAPLRVVPLGIVPADGRLEFAFAAPDLAPGDATLNLYGQLLTANPAGSAVLGESDLLVLLDGAL